jgi:hypothetical protein
MICHHHLSSPSRLTVTFNRRFQPSLLTVTSSRCLQPLLATRPRYLIPASNQGGGRRAQQSSQKKAAQETPNCACHRISNEAGMRGWQKEFEKSGQGLWDQGGLRKNQDKACGIRAGFASLSPIVFSESFFQNRCPQGSP